MSEESKKTGERIAALELNRETVQDLNENEAEEGQGGAIPCGR